jgi:membrane protease YdiL (CAAX protease family)
VSESHAETPPAGRAASYVDHARDGSAGALTYTLGTLLIVMAWLFVGGIASVALALLVSPGTPSDRLGSLTGAGGLAVSLVGFVPLLLATPLVVRWVQQRPWLTLVTGHPPIRWRRVLVGAAWWALLVLLASGVDALVHRDAYSWTYDPARFWPALAVAVVLIPLQTTAEELFFRGWLVQWLSTGLHRALLVAAADGLIFAVPHLANPEAAGAQWYAWLVWWIYGAGWAWASLRDGSIELAVGAHAANNLVGVVLVAYSASVLPTDALWTTSALDLPLTIAVLAVVQLAFLRLTRPRGAGLSLRASAGSR